MSEEQCDGDNVKREILIETRDSQDLTFIADESDENPPGIQVRFITHPDGFDLLTEHKDIVAYSTEEIEDIIVSQLQSCVIRVNSKLDILNNPRYLPGSMGYSTYAKFTIQGERIDL